MNEKIRQTKRTLENLLGKKLEGDFDTVAQVYNAFNEDCEANGAPGGGGGGFVVEIDDLNATLITPVEDVFKAVDDRVPIVVRSGSSVYTVTTAVSDFVECFNFDCEYGQIFYRRINKDGSIDMRTYNISLSSGK